MDATELDVALEELESRLERLRALYEQYFMGIERIEPAIPRKDVDRRIYVLRREKIRNTAKRFKLQTIIQRYNTFQQYWQRICREIENGTYKRHVLRVERQGADALLTIAARKRLGRQRGSSRPPPPGEAAALAGAPSSFPPSAPPPAADLAAPASRPPPPRTPAPKPALESLSLDMEFLGDWDPGAQAQRSSRPKPAPVASLAGTPPAAVPPPKPALKPPPKPMRPAQAAPPAAAPSPPRPAAPAPMAAAPPAKPIPPPKPRAAPVAAKPAPKPAAAAGPKTIAEEQVRSLHARLLEAKKQTKESSSVSVEGLSRSLEATAAKLREQHKNRKIEFDVVIKDGKALVKPIVR